MRTIFISVFFFVFTMSSNAQFIIAGHHTVTDYYNDIPDTFPSLPTPNSHGQFFIDINGDSLIDFNIQASHWVSPGSTGNYFYISSKNNNQIALGYIDTCGEAMAKSFSANDSINSNANWSDNDTLQYMSFFYYSGMPPYVSTCSDHSFDTSKAFLGVRIFLSTDTLYGWIMVDGNKIIYEYACNSGIPLIINADTLTRIDPNPVSTFLTVQFYTGINIQQRHFEITDMLGQIIYKAEVSSNRKNQIDLSGIRKGVYIVQLFDDNNFLQKKIIKQ